MTVDESVVLDAATAHGFTLVNSEELHEIEGQAYVMRHDATGARLLFLDNDDTNKSFSISFKTPPTDDTGVFHILEHSVLCGSDRYPVKEPFVNLLKSSMQTFLNAMTFPDKTMYPVASTNDQDLENLASVYLDAMFHPAIYHRPAIFQQEGWHIETADSLPDVGLDPESFDGEEAIASDIAAATESFDSQSSELPRLTYNGVVYNEMKGALADPDSVLFDTLSAALFPDTTYRFESGGTPQAIPTLTYEQFLDIHQRHYRPDNSYIILYGALDIDRFLGFLDTQYLSPLAQAQANEKAGQPNALELQAPCIASGVTKEMATTPDNSCMALGFVVGTAAERERVIATDILLDALLGSNEAPLKKALLEANIATDASGFLVDAIAQPFAMIQIKGLKPGAQEQFPQIVEQTAQALAQGQLDRALIEASLSHAEFVMRERNYSYPDGVVLSMNAMAGWLYDDDAPCTYLRYEDAFKTLRTKIEQGYFEELLAELLLHNNHRGSAEVIPVPSVADPTLEALAQKAAALGPDDIEAINQTVADLRAAQEAPDSPEALATLPQLSVDDIGEAPTEDTYGLLEQTPIPCLRHDVKTHGITYLYQYFPMDELSYEDLPYAHILAMLLGKLDTAYHSAAEIDVLAQSRLGSMAFFAEVDEFESDLSAFVPVMVMGATALDEKFEDAVTLPREVARHTRFDDFARIGDVLMQSRLSYEQSFANMGHSYAMARVASYRRRPDVVREQLRGMDFYRFLKDLTDNYTEDAQAALTAKLQEIQTKLFDRPCRFVSFTGPDQNLARFWELLDATPATQESLGAGSILAPSTLAIPEPEIKNEAFIVPTDVTYTAVGSDLKALGGTYGGSWLLACRAATYDFLWNEVRVKGGAYGVGLQALRSGTLRAYSYRDPRIDETLERFAGVGPWIANFNPTDAELDGYIISTVASFDSPLKAREVIRRQDGFFIAGVTPEMRRQLRQELIEGTPESIQALGSTIAEAMDPACRCTIGNRETIAQALTDFTEVDLLA